MTHGLHVMRIHVYLRDFPPDGVELNSGIIKAVHGLAVGFVRNGANVTILCDGPRTSVVQSPEGFDIRCFARDGGLANGAATIPRALDHYIETCDDPGIFLLNSVFSPNVYLVSRACLRRRIPYIVAPHDPYHPTIFMTRSYLKWPYWYLRERPMLCEAAAVQVLDMRHAEWLRAYGVHTPVIEVRNGFAPEDVQPLDSLTWRLDGPPRLLYLGRIDSHNKGLDFLIEAFAQLSNQTDARLTLQGPDWRDKEAMVRLAQRLNMSDRIDFRLPDYTKPAALITAEHDIFLLPSRFEGFGLSALEAMLSGRVVLVSDVAGIAPHVRASGCGIVIPADVQHVRSALLELLSMRPRWKEMGLAGREYALKHLRWDQIAAETMEEYRQLFRTASHRELVGAGAG